MDKVLLLESFACIETDVRIVSLQTSILFAASKNTELTNDKFVLYVDLRRWRLDELRLLAGGMVLIALIYLLIIIGGILNRLLRALVVIFTSFSVLHGTNFSKINRCLLVAKGI